MKNALCFTPPKPSLFSRYLKFCLGFFGHIEKRVDQKDKFIFKACDLLTRLMDNY